MKKFPEKWCIQVTPDNHKIVSAWFRHVLGREVHDLHKQWLWHYPEYAPGDCILGFVYDGYTKISYLDFLDTAFSDFELDRFGVVGDLREALQSEVISQGIGIRVTPTYTPEKIMRVTDLVNILQRIEQKVNTNTWAPDTPSAKEEQGTCASDSGRSIVKLLQILKDNLYLIEDGFPETQYRPGGLCRLSLYLIDKKLISYDERIRLTDYIKKYAPARENGSLYNWPRFKVLPRLAWLEEKIAYEIAREVYDEK